MRVTIISHSYLAEENQKNIRALAARAEVNVLLPRSSREALVSRIDVSPETLRDPRFFAYPRLALPGSQYLLLSADLNMRRFQPDIVHLEYDPWATIFWQALACRNSFAPRAKILCTVKNNTYRRHAGLLGTMKDRMATAGVRRTDHFLAASHKVARLYETTFGVRRSRISVMHHLGVDVSLFTLHPDRNAPSGDRITVGYCGRLDEDKGVLELFEAVRRCRDGGMQRLSLEYLGSGRLRDRLAKLQETHSWFRIFPPVPHRDVPTFLGRLDVFVLPARVSADHEEHDAHALLEAMAVGVPSIGTRSGIIPEILEDGTGLLVDANSETAIESALRELCGNATLRHTLSQRARAKATACFSVETLADRRLAVYEEVLHGS